MYTHCMFCQAGLGANEEIEHFPVGRCLAYDRARGRLWVVCPRCHRWNLTPLQERWEAIDECERAFRAARLRASTENISVARTASRMDLVRIGEPLRREMAFWRWGDRFGARRRRALILSGVGTTALTVSAVGNMLTGSAAFVALYGLLTVQSTIRVMFRRVKVRCDDGRSLMLHAPAMRLARFGESDGSRAPALVVPGSWNAEEILTGERATRAAAVILPRLNAHGAREGVVRDAADAIEDGGGPEGYVAAAWGDRTRVGTRLTRPMGRAGKGGVLALLPPSTRVAMEMALHEEEERRALNGELAGLEAMWRAAEEIAAISDDLFVPSGWAAFKRKHHPLEEKR